MIYTNTKPLKKPKKLSKAVLEQYATWCKQYGIDPNGKNRKKKVTVIDSPVVVTKPYIRETRKIPSLSTPGDASYLKPAKVYTGGNILGIAQMHKSNAVPVFKAEDAVDIAHMRR